VKRTNRRKIHVIKRLKERVGTHISPSLIEENLKHKDIIFIKRVSCSRSIGYLLINNTPIKLVYGKGCKKAITILPISYDFEFPKDGWFEILYENNKTYRIKIFPDCYMETENKRVMTKFEVWNDNEMKWEEKKRADNIFNYVFDIAWENYETHKKYKILSNS
jgi:hypothetical protein